MDATEILVKPIITEKTTWQAARHNAYVFHVSPKADKHSVKRAIGELYNVKVAEVRIAVRKGKSKRNKFGTFAKPTVKRAIVVLAGDDRIDLF
jgi:large subunit ribosomal protein L23